MIHDIPKPDISPAFTIEDIHIIREWNYERLKDATPEERSADIERRAQRTRQLIFNGGRADHPDTTPPQAHTQP